jgi:hypothetical protein
VDVFSKGMVVRHTTLGVGRVVAVEPTAVHIFFAAAERREASKLRISAAKVFLSPDPKAQDERLENLPAFAFDPVSGRYAPERSRAVSARKAKAKK